MASNSVLPSVHLISLNKKYGLKCFRNLTEIKQDFIIILYISLAIHRDFRNWHQILYNRSRSYKIHALPIFVFLV